MYIPNRVSVGVLRKFIKPEYFFTTLAIYILLKAIEKAQTLDTDVVAKTLESLTGETPLSKVPISWGGAKRYGIAHQLNCPTYLTEMQSDGSLKVLAKGVASVP